MDWTVFTTPVIGLIGVFVGAAISSSTTRRTHRERLAADRELAERRNAAELALAERKFQYDRDLASWKRRTELAEQVLADFYEAKEIIEEARSPGGFGDEGNTRVKETWETEGDTRTLNAYFRTAERLIKKFEFFARLNSHRYRFLALFGSEAGKPYDDLFRIRGEIIVAVRMLITTYSQRDMGDLPQTRQGWQATIGWRPGPEDPITARLNEVVTAIEKICQPIIQNIPG